MSRARSSPAILATLRGFLARSPSRLRWLGLLATLGLLLWHVWRYRFLCDDAFISFRYARNLSRGFGLVFNPNMERVEGYTNFLWVILLAAGDWLGSAPERSAHVLSLLATVALWGMVAWFAARARSTPRIFALVPVLLLAATRSVAVWSTSGLETRAFEALVLAAVLRLIVEAEALLSGRRGVRPVAGGLFALAALTRPEGLLIGCSALGASALLLLARRRLDLRWLVASALLFALPAGAHLAFRRFYYGEWLPNTFAAKVGGQTWWGVGGKYLATFVIEYAAWLWLPILALAVASRLRRGEAHVPLIFGAVVIPHAIYVASVGGDHFEYRPLDLYFPYAYLLLGEGLAALARGRRRTWLAGAYGAGMLVGIVDLPWRSHAEFPTSYAGGFPGEGAQLAEGAADFMNPARDPVYRWPGLRTLAEIHRANLRSLTAHFVGIRQEEHRLFLGTVIHRGRRLRELVDQGLLPEDTHLAIDCVGAIPYYSDLRVLDRRGLTDAHVARSAFVNADIMAHGKLATIAYARQQEVDLWAVDPVRTILPITATRILSAVRSAAKLGEEIYIAELGNQEYLLCQLPMGLAHASERMPNLVFRDVRSREFIHEYTLAATTAFEELLESDPDNALHLRRLAFLYTVKSRFEEARAIDLHLVQIFPNDGESWENLGIVQAELGDRPAAAAALTRALDLARARGDTDAERRLQQRLVSIGARSVVPEPSAAP